MFEMKAQLKTDNILIINQGVLGDTLLSLEAVKQIINSNPNCNIYIACSSSLVYLYELYGMSFAHFIEIESAKGNWPEFREFRRVAKEIRAVKYKAVYLIRFIRTWEILMASIAESEMYSCFMYKQYEKIQNSISKFLLANMFSNIYIEKDSVFLGRAYKNYLGKNGINYISKGCRLEVSEEKAYKELYGNYILFSPMSAVKSREMSYDSIKEILNGLLSATNYKIIISGKQEDFLKIESVMRDCLDDTMQDRVMNLAGRTNLLEFMQLIKQSRLVIGVDSGQIHLAAALNTPSIALCGYWNPPQFLPYDYEEIDVSYPKCIFSRNAYKCKYCQSSNGGWHHDTRPNPICDKRERNGQTFLCLDDIDLQDVMSAVTKVLNKKDSGRA